MLCGLPDQIFIPFKYPNNVIFSDTDNLTCHRTINLENIFRNTFIDIQRITCSVCVS